LKHFRNKAERIQTKKEGFWEFLFLDSILEERKKENLQYGKK
jgi:hypothetical protein